MSYFLLVDSPKYQYENESPASPLPPTLPPPPTSPPPPPPPPQEPDQIIEDNDDVYNFIINFVRLLNLIYILYFQSRSDSPTLNELKQQKLRLLAALDSSLNSTSLTNCEDSLIEDIMALDESTIETTFVEDTTGNVPEDSSNSDVTTEIPITAVPARLSIDNDRPETPTATTPTATTSSATTTTPLNNSKQLVFGTPLLKSVSPFTTLPVGDSWSVGVSDNMDFENLPDATGKYVQMKGVIEKVRKTVKQLNEEYE